MIPDIGNINVSVNGIPLVGIGGVKGLNKPKPNGDYRTQTPQRK